MLTIYSDTIYNVNMITTGQRQNVAELKREVGLLRSFVIGAVGKDKEGQYRPEFVEKILRATENNSAHLFTDPHSFLGKLRKQSR